MTESRRWIDARRAELGWREMGAGALRTVGLVLAALGLGVWLARLGLYRDQPVAVLGSWLAVALAGIAGVVWHRRRALRADARTVAADVEQGGGLRRGAIAGTLDMPSGSRALATLADGRAMAWLETHGHGALRESRRARSRTLGRSTIVAAIGGGLFAASGPASSAGADFWRPITALTRAAGPVTVSVDRESVRRGQTITVLVGATGRRAATLWVRAPGEPWSPLPLALDADGHAMKTIGPLESDRYVRATSGAKESPTVHVRVSLPALLADVQLIAQYPHYLDLPDEPLATGPDPVLLPVGTVVATKGRSTQPLQSAAWRRQDGSVHTLQARGTEFAGALPIHTTGRWELIVVPQGAPLDGPSPELSVVAVPDSAPVIVVPVPGADTSAPLSLRQPLVIDARDDHRVMRAELVTRRVSRLGLAGAPQTDTLPLPEGGTERAVVQWTLDLNGRGYLPGDTAHYRVRAWDNAPHPQMSETRDFTLRLPSSAELREALREASRAFTAAADSLVGEQRDLAQATEELSAERERASDAARQPPGSRASPQGDLPFRSAQRAGEIADQQQSLADRARELRDELDQLQKAAENAGLNDPQWQAELKELEKLLDRAVTPELEQQLQALREALEKLDPEALREALKRLAESGKDMREQLSRSRELFQRAALEGTMSTLAQDAQELAQQQRDWNRQADAGNADSALARAEASLSQEADSLAARLDQLKQALRRDSERQQAAQEAQQQAQQASQAMQQAAQQTQAGESERARQSGAEAQKALDPIADQLRQQRDAMRDEWRQEVMETLDRALSETADLAQRQMEVSQRMQRGDASADVRGEQAALREGADRVLQRLQSAAGKNALVSPQVGTTMGFARLRMTEAIDRLQRALPNPSEAGELAGQAVDGLNAMTHALLRSRQDVSGSESGSGLQEAIQRMAELAAQQQALNGQAGGMLPLMPLGGQGLLQDLRALAERQRRMASELERLGAQGQTSGADALAQEARDLARRLEAGQLDRRTIERQERLFRRLLDAGRTLRGEEEDDKKERTSQTARQDNVRLPAALRPGDLGKGPRFPYPTWDQLQQLSPDERRLILDYFRRLNEGRP